MSNVKPRDSSDEEHDLAGQARDESGNWVVPPLRPPAGSVRNVSGVVAGPGPRLDPQDDDATTVGPALLPLLEEQQAALSRRIRTALGQTLPLGTPAPEAVTNGGARRPWARTMMLGGRQVPGLQSSGPAPSAPESSSEFPDASARSAPVQRSARASVPSPVQQRRADATSEAATLRASFVRTVGMPTAPPPRRSRRPGAPESELEPPSEPAPRSEPAPLSDSEHEAFALERPLTLTGLPAVGRTSATAAVDAPSPARNDLTARGPMTGQMLPPPPQPADYEPPSSRSSPPPLPPAFAAVTAASVPRAPAATLLTDLPSANPFEGFEAPRETFLQRFLIVFVVALAVVGLLALGALAFGFLGKTGW